MTTINWAPIKMFFFWLTMRKQYLNGDTWWVRCRLCTRVFDATTGRSVFDCPKCMADTIKQCEWKGTP